MRALLIVCLASIVASGCAVFDRNGMKESISQPELLADAERLYGTGNVEEAERLLIKAKEINPNDAQIVYRLGTIAFKKGDQDLAASYFVKAIEINPRNSKAHFNLATIRLMQAESHFKYYIATTDPKADIERLSDLMGAIEQYASSVTKK